MIGFVRWIIGFAALVIILCLIAFNPQIVTFNWNPAAEPVTIPLYTIILGIFIFGYGVGLLYLWFNQLPKQWERNKKLKEQDKHIKQLEQTIENYEQTSAENILRD